MTPTATRLVGQEIAVVATGEMPGPPLDRAAALARHIADSAPTALVVPSFDANHRLRRAVAPAVLELVKQGKLEGVRKWMWLVRHRPSVIYCVGGWLRNVVPAVLARPVTGSKVVADFDEVMSRWPSKKRWLYRLLERMVIPRLDGLVVVSSAMETWALSIGARPDRVFKVPFAAHTSAIAEIASRSVPAKRSQTRVDVGYLGSLTPHYDFWYLLDALEALVLKWPDVKLQLVGDGSARAELEEQARARGLDGRIRFHGFLTLPFPGIAQPEEEAVQCLAQCDALLFPIRDTEINRLRCPQKSYVFLATGVPVVTSTVGEVPGACEDFAWYFDMADPASLVAAVAEALNEPPERRVARRAFAVRVHSWEVRARDCWAQLTKAIFETPHHDEGGA